MYVPCDQGISCAASEPCTEAVGQVPYCNLRNFFSARKCILCLLYSDLTWWWMQYCRNNTVGKSINSSVLFYTFNEISFASLIFICYCNILSDRSSNKQYAVLNHDDKLLVMTVKYRMCIFTGNNLRVWNLLNKQSCYIVLIFL